ncbi:ribonuclease R [Ketogulonicigenium vulgare]|uniref:Ribonuclease R n=1 Tax=Ketogulonicigenium vulgare (strain WSH-001) TaxID=759362 RepID=F9Y5P4_KETVW|nr:ribonuclease R [Ketogulonicigenium vulgare]ADO43700.1 ribonuclease R [Ketogulonicigenium vulgare Y25]AEM41969.1 Ribonuclease R [Ketogulonicigenium vulgare WSH-001]ALJ82068.1 ribonuclease R [Ketogulonicigenium vulgare]ANW34695.1 ribonuclease R [Ketogulonicigenium vulgare]AOZ55734.1 ribonuclease R [Ketogulonicigenium vulgare]
MNQIPSREAILQWIADNPTLTAKRDIAKAFGIKGAARIDLKRVLRELEDEGHLQKRSRSYREADKLPPISVVEVEEQDADGDIFLRPLEWNGAGDPPRILLVAQPGDPAIAAGERVLAKLTATHGEDHDYTARTIRRLGTNPLRILGVYRQDSEGGRIMPVDKADHRQWVVAQGLSGGALDGELVEAEQAGPKGRLGLPKARIIARLGDPTAPRAVSLIAIRQHGIPDHFPDAAVMEADAAEAVTSLDGRTDLTHLALVTIDPPDARDRDDAVLAEADPDNAGGFILWVAIADVAHYVTPGSALDREAKKRGNSTYFPDRVVPMLPDRLSGDMCSLHANVPRACLAVRMVIDAEGHKTGHTFFRGVMKSRASLSYAEVQDAIDGTPSEATAPLLEPVLQPLYAAYDALLRARAARQPLELDLPERQIILSDEGKVTSVAFKERLDAHKLIEEFMVLANVAAAEELNKKKTPLLFRVHEEPAPEKLEALREMAQASGLQLAKGQVLHTRHLNRLLAQAANSDQAEVINIATLRSMTQAYYSPQNFGHFGLALRNYAHFTSPIRRYSDLIVHRALISANHFAGYKRDGLTPADIEELQQTGEQISATERRSMVAERDTTDRYLAAFLSERIGAEMTGRISGVMKFGLFIRLDDTGADGLVPIRSLGNEYFHYDRESQTLMGGHSGIVFEMGQRVTVRLAEATAATGGITLELIERDGQIMARGPRGGGGKSGHRMPGKSRAKLAKVAAKEKRKVLRKRS